MVLGLSLNVEHRALQSIANTVLQNINSDLFASSVASIVVNRLHESEKRHADETQREHGQSGTTPKAMDRSVASRPKEYSTACTTSKFGRFMMTCNGATGAWKALIQPPRWLSESVYHIQYIPCVSGWTYVWRTYNIIPTDSDARKRIKAGDREGLLKLFSARKASPFDRTACGDSLLDVSSMTPNREGN